jgi:dolichol-phosphate mannosyltransferase
MATAVPLLSIVCPAYEEEDVLPQFHAELCGVLDRLNGADKIEIIYVDDGSRDGTLALLRRLAQQDERVRYLSLSRNFGHQAALTAGLEHARGDAVITLDSDLQHPPSLIPLLLEKWRQGHNVVLTIRAPDVHLSQFKQVTSRWFYRVMRRLSSTEVRPAAADFRLMSRKAVDALLRLRESHRFLRGMVQWLGFSTAEVPFEPAPRKAGVSKYTLRRMVSFALDGLTSFSLLPLRLAWLGGLSLWLLALGTGLIGVLSWLCGSPASAGLLLILIHLDVIGGALLFGLGILGEYVGLIQEQVKQRPLYVLKETEADLSAGAVRSPQPDPRSTAA